MFVDCYSSFFTYYRPAPKENVKSIDSLKRPKTGSQEDIKTSHEEKKHKSMKEELQITKPKVPVMRCK